MLDLDNIQNQAKSIQSSLGNLNNIELPKLDMSKYNDIANMIQEDIAKQNRQRTLREVENNESLKSIVQYNEEISNFNRELVSLNEKILKKINSLDDTLLFLNKAFDNKSEMDKKQGQEQMALLLQLITIIEEKDENKLKQFMGNIGTPIAVGLVVEFLKIKLGLTS